MVETHNKIATDAIMHLVNTMIDAHLSGFTDRNHLTLAELHRIAENHIQDNYNHKVKTLKDAYGDEVVEVLSKSSND